jgi:hypothetical protein
MQNMRTQCRAEDATGRQGRAYGSLPARVSETVVTPHSSFSLDEPLRHVNAAASALARRYRL